jgi:hypothetical protein
VTLPSLPGVRVRVRRATWQVRVARVADLAALAAVAVGEPGVTGLEVDVERWRPPVAGWIGRPGIAGVTAVEITPDGAAVRLRLSWAEQVDPAVALAAAVRCLRPSAITVGPELTATAGLPPAAGMLADRLHDVHLPGEQRDRHVRRADVLLVGAGAVDPDIERASTVVIDAGTWTRDGHAVEVCVDPAVHRPIGRRSTVEGVVATATRQGDRVHIVSAGSRISIDGQVDASQVAALRKTDAVVGELTGTVARQLAACGILTAESADALPDPADALAWQVASVHERRHALRMYTPAVALDGWPSVSVLLVTHRPDHLERALAQVARLRYPRLEIVVGVHGDRVDPEWVASLAAQLPFPSSVVSVAGGRTLGEALQECSQRASGTLLTKVDDDDHYGPEHIWDLVLAHQYSGAQIVGKALDWIHLAALGVTSFRPVYPAERYADFVAGGTMLIARADLDAVGGWRPVPKSVDRALLDRVLGDGGLVYRTHGLGYVYVRGGHGHTATVSDEHFLTKTTAVLDGLVTHEEFGTVRG